VYAASNRMADTPDPPTRSLPCRFNASNVTVVTPPPESVTESRSFAASYWNVSHAPEF